MILETQQSQEQFYRSLLAMGRILRDSLEDAVDTVFQRVAEQLAGDLELPVVWIGRLAPGATWVQVVATAGAAREYTEGLRISSLADIPEGRGPGGRVLRSGEGVIAGDVVNAPDFAPWRERAIRFALGGNMTAAATVGDGGQVIIGLFHHIGGAFPWATAPLMTGLVQDLAAFLRQQATAKDYVRLQSYQEAAIAAQQELLRQEDPQAMYQRLVDIVVAQTAAIGAYIVTLVADGEGLGIMAMAADDPTLCTAMEQVYIAQDLRNGAHRDALASLAFREKSPQGPVGSPLSPGMQALQRHYPALLRIRGAMAFPVFAGDAAEPAAVLLIQADDPGHFTPPLQQLLAQLATSLGLALSQWRQHCALVEAEAAIHQMAFYDDLTGLPNRRLLENQLEQDMARSKRHGKLLAVCMLDLDGFKPVNDSYGHDAGDEVLAALGQRLRAVLRKSDFVARLGGDEFVLLVEDISDLNDLTRVLDKAQTAITTPIPLSNGAAVRLQASIGVCLHPFGEGKTGDQLLRRADQALYESKAHKADRDRSWVFFGEEVARERQRTPAQRLLDEGALEVWYQPILANHSRKVVGMEALARLRDHDGRILYPGEFLPQLATEDLTDLSRLVLTQALADLTILDTRGWFLWVSFNVTPESFCGQCVPCLQGVIAASGIDPSRITLEILEGSDFLERDTALSVLHEIKALGIRLALDDIGSAYVSLLRLKELPVDEIKLDQGFIRTLEARPQDLHFVRTIQDLAMELKVDLVVEGVETADILDAMMTTGAPYLQGYAISRPIPFAQLQPFLAGYSCPDHDLPKSLFGFYAGTLSSHSAIKKMLMINPSEMNPETLGNAMHCRGHGVLHRLGYGDDSHLLQLHNNYHRALGDAAENATESFKNHGWDAVEESLELFLAAVMSEWRMATGNARTHAHDVPVITPPSAPPRQVPSTSPGWRANSRNSDRRQP
ncbi:bifunctional diguanylate cyclase/phosphodiesterase [Acidithiobacillus sulfuriphilus]|uniref:bifunctional diguanylate cyclase/phosphodiesterase n=1 Tax=Acidithiobacillus sulfuriphilus TaxID=1867749 RepID=UPI003F63B23B